MKIAYVFPFFSHKKFEEDLDIVSCEFCQPPPLGLAYAAAISETSGHEAIIIDANARPGLSKPEVLARIDSFDPDILGFMLTAYMFRQTLEWIEYLKQNTDLPVIVGNILLEIYPNEVMTHKEIDYGIIGPAVKSLPELLSAVEKKTEIKNIKGICYREGGNVVINRPETLREDFDVLPYPARHLLQNHMYSTIVSKRKNFSIMITSKGCKSKCGFCYVQNIPYSSRSPEGVIQEIDECVREYGIREIEFFDPVFTYDRERVMEICRLLIEKKHDLIWTCRSRVDQVDPKMLDIMKQAGCARIYYGIECGNQSVLNRVAKGTSLEQIRETIEDTRKAGIKTLGFFIFGVPGETIEEMNETVEFALSLDLDYAQFHKAVPKPGGYLNDKVTEYLGYDYWREYILGNKEEMHLPTPWTDVSPAEIEKITIKSYHRFYFTPKKLIKIIIGIKSFEEFFRYVRSAIGLLSVRSDLK